MLALLQLLIATTLLCSANGCGDEAEKRSGLPMSVAADSRQGFKRVGHENKLNRINSVNGSDQQMIGANKTNDLQIRASNCSNALVANEYLTRSNGSNNSKHEVSTISVNTTDFPLRNADLFLRVLSKNYSRTSNKMRYFNFTFHQNKSSPRKYLQDLELVKLYRQNIAPSLKSRPTISADKRPSLSMKKIEIQNFSNNSVDAALSPQFLALRSNIGAQPGPISKQKRFKYFIKNEELNTDSYRRSGPALPSSYARNNQGTKLNKNYKECSKRDSKTRTKRHRERYGFLSSLLRHSNSDRLGIFDADNTGFDPKTIGDRSQSDSGKSSANSILKSVELSNGKTENSSRIIVAERLKGEVSTSVESIGFQKQPVMLSLSADSNESSVSYPLEPDPPSPDIVPLEDLRTEVEEVPRNRTPQGDKKRLFFPLGNAQGVNESAVELSKKNEYIDKNDTRLRCITCNSTTDHNFCYNLPQSNETDNFEEEDLSQVCEEQKKYCLASHIWYVDKTGENKSYHHFSIERRCAKTCEPYYIVMGDKTKMEIISNRMCCQSNNCNRQNGAARGTPLLSLLAHKVSFALLIFFKLSERF